MDPVDDRSLVEAYLSGRSEEAFRALYRAHTPYLFCLALRLAGGRRDEAEEAVQEAWLRAAERMAGFRWRSSLRTWISGILINCCREIGRRRRRDVVLVEPAGRHPSAPSRIDLERSLAELPDPQRHVVVLFYVEGYTHEEIAGLLDIAPGTSKSRLFEARRKLRRRLAAEPRLSGDTP